METLTYAERNMVESYAAILGGLRTSTKLELMDRLLKSLKNEYIKVDEPAIEFIPEKSAEQIISEIRKSRNFGKTRILESF
jgi:hypothetical protein